MKFKWVNNLGLRSFKIWGGENDTMTHLPEFLQFFLSKKIRGDSVIEFLTSHDSFHQIVDGILMTRTIACLQAIKTESLISKVSTPNALSLFSIDWAQVITVKHGSKFREVQRSTRCPLDIIGISCIQEMTYVHEITRVSWKHPRKNCGNWICVPPIVCFRTRQPIDGRQLSSIGKVDPWILQLKNHANHSPIYGEGLFTQKNSSYTPQKNPKKNPKNPRIFLRIWNPFILFGSEHLLEFRVLTFFYL